MIVTAVVDANISLTGTSYAVLAAVMRLGEGSSYDIKGILGGAPHAFWSIPHTTAYEEPLRLLRHGLLAAAQEDGGRRRRTFALTAAGKDALRAWLTSRCVPQPELRDEGLLKVFAGADPLPLLRSSAEWHRKWLRELEEQIDQAEAA